MLRVSLVISFSMCISLAFADSNHSLEGRLKSLEAGFGTLEKRRLAAIEDLEEDFFGKYQENIVLKEPEIKIASLREKEVTIRLVFNWHLKDGAVDQLMRTLAKYFNATNSGADPDFYAHMKYAKEEHSEIHDSLVEFMKSRGIGLRVKFMGRTDDLYIFPLPGIYPKSQQMWIEFDVDRKSIKGTPPVKVEVRQYDSIPCSGVSCWEESWRVRSLHTEY